MNDEFSTNSHLICLFVPNITVLAAYRNCQTDVNDDNNVIKLRTMFIFSKTKIQSSKAKKRQQWIPAAN